MWNGGWERRTIFLLFPRDGSLYLPLPDVQQFIVEYRKMSENVGRSWKMSVLKYQEENQKSFLYLERGGMNFFFRYSTISSTYPPIISSLLRVGRLDGGSQSNDPPSKHSWFLLPCKSWLIRPPLMHNSLQLLLHQLPSKSNVTQRCIWRVTLSNT